MMTQAFDTIVIGAGAVGSAALWQLACRGVRALAIDRFAPPHDRGSSHGQSRIIREAYFEHPDYVPLVRRAFDAWQELEQQANTQLYYPTGLLQVGPPDGAVISGIRSSAERFGLDVETLGAAEIERRFAGFCAAEPLVGMFERRAGFLKVEACIAAALRLACERGAQLNIDETVTGWRAEGTGVVVETNCATYRAQSLIITAGAWATQLLAKLQLPLTVRRKVQLWFEPASDNFAIERGAPCFLYDTPAGIYYGFPVWSAAGLKVAEHTGGERVEDPLALDRRLDASDVASARHFLQQFLPDAAGALLQQAVCMYTLTPDHHFVVDRHPTAERVVFAAGLSGHGFKFAPVLGEALVDLALNGKTALPVGFLSRARFAC